MGSKGVDSIDTVVNQIQERVSSVPMNHEFHQALIVEYKALKDLVYPLMTHVCDPRGMEKADTAHLFDARCSTCLVKLDTNVLLEIAASQVTGTPDDDSSGQAQPIPSSCPK